MKTAEAIEILEQHNNWRRGADTESTNPKNLGIAIETAIGIMKIYSITKTNQCCGSCVKFKYESIDGDGVCGVSDFAKRCDEGTDCKFHKAKKK